MVCGLALRSSLCPLRMQACLEMQACSSPASFLDASGVLFTWPALGVERLEFSLETFSGEIRGGCPPL